MLTLLLAGIFLFYFLCKKICCFCLDIFGGKSLNYIIVVFWYTSWFLIQRCFQSDGGVFYFAYHLFMSCNLHTFITFQLKYKFIFSHLFVFTCEGRDRLTIKGFSFVERLFRKGGNLIFLYCLLKKSEWIKLLLSFVDHNRWF